MIKGYFNNIKNHNIEVIFYTSGEDILIGNDKDSEVYFTDDPVLIEEDMDDTFTTIIKRSCKIELLSSIYLGDYLFTKNDKEIKVEVKDTTSNFILFSGYVLPLTFSQEYNSSFNTFSVNCIDLLSTFENHKYKEEVDYDDALSNAENVTFKDILQYAYGNDYKVYFDNSVSIEGSSKNIFEDIYISELLLLGDDESSVWTMEEVINEILQYLNLHTRFYNGDYYIYSFDNVKKNTEITFKELFGNSTISYTISDKQFKSGDYASNDTNLEIADTYNQIQLTCDLKELETVISNPLDDESLYSPFSNKQMYAKLYFGEGSDKARMMDFIISEKPQSNQYLEEYFMQRFFSNTWKFNGDSLVEKDFNGNYINQSSIMKELNSRSCKSAIIATGVAPKKTIGDNEPSSKIDMKKKLIISICGNNKQIEGVSYPNEMTLSDNMPIAEYSSNKSGGVYSPSDEYTTNYLVFSGDFVLKAQYPQSGDINYLSLLGKGFSYLITPRAYKENDTGMAMFEYYNAETPNSTPKMDNLTGAYMNYIQPFISDFNYAEGDNHGGVPDKGIRKLQYNYSSFWDGETDTFSKLPVLLCELKIGEKYCIEWDSKGNFTPNEFRWVKENEIPYSNGVKLSTMTLGCNPKINDWIINQEHHIANTLEYTQNVDAEGTAIPIKASDRLSGQLTFKIISPFNAVWDVITRVHPTGFRHTKWGETSRLILPYLDYIVIESFECKLYTDNGGLNNTIERDLVYTSNQIRGNYNVKDDITFRINTGLSSEEANIKGVSTNPKLSNPIYNEFPLQGIKNNVIGEVGKPEELYIDSLWREYQKPLIILETTVHYDTINDNPFKHYTVSKEYKFKNNKVFYPLTSEIQIKYNRNTIKLKEINND